MVQHYQILLSPLPTTLQATPPAQDTNSEKAMGWTGFNIEQLRRIARQFNMDEGNISLQRYSFSKEEFFYLFQQK